MIAGVPRLLGPSGERIEIESLQLTRSLEQLSGVLSWTSRESVADRLVRECEVRDRTGRRLFRGFIERCQGSPTAGFSCTARSLTSALVVTDAAGTEYFRRSSALAILRTLAVRTGVPMASGAAPTRTVRRFRLERGESYARALQRLAGTHRFIVTDDANGGLRGYTLPATVDAQWVDGSFPVIDAIAVDLDFADWRDEWVCRGQREVVSPELAEGNAQIRVAIATGARRKSRRVLPSRSASSKADAARFVEWQARKALAATVGVEVGLAEWPAGVDAGSRVHVRSPSQGIDDELIVAGLSLEINGSTYRARASCVPPETYSFRPLRGGTVEKRVDRWKVNDGKVQNVSLKP